MRGATKPHHTSQVDTVGLYLAQSPHRGTKRFQYLWSWPGTLVAAVGGGWLLCETTVTKMEWASSWLFIAPLPQVLYLLRGLCTYVVHCCLSGGTVQWCTWQLSMHLRTWGASSPSTLSAPDLHTESGLVPAALTGDLRLEQIGIWVNNHKTNDYLLEIFMVDIHVLRAKTLRDFLASWTG